MSGKGKSKLQQLAQKRNSAKGRIKGLRNNLRGLLSDNEGLKYLHEDEIEDLQFALHHIELSQTDWDNKWEQIKGEL